MLSIRKVLTFSFLYSSIAISAEIPVGTKILVCGDGAGWPPYTYETPTKSVAGYDVDILERILSKKNIASSVKMEPWKRCLKETEEGSYHIATSSAFNEERNKTYLMTRHYYSMTPSYFYSKNRYPNGLDIKTAADLQKYRVCGLLGYNYANFGIPVEQIDTGTKKFEQLVEKTNRNRCDVFFARSESFITFAYLGVNFIEKYNLGYKSIPGSSREKFYLLISRNFKYAQELKKIIDDELDVLEPKGELDKMVAKSIEDIKTTFSK